jgi:protein-disulfide isomerase
MTSLILPPVIILAMNSESIDPIEEKKEKKFITFKINKSALQAFLIPGVFLLGLWVGYLSWGKDIPQTAIVPAADAPSNPSALENGQQAKFEIDVLETDPTLGDENALITIVEFSDFECPYCKRHNQEVLGKIIDTYGNQIQYVFKDFPLYGIHPNAIGAAVAAHCANQQNSFWEYHDLIFGDSLGFSDDAYMQYAIDINLDVNQFALCLTSDSAVSLVQNNYELGESLGVASTPSFFINGTALIGAQPFEVFSQVIEAELAKVNN